MDRKFQCSPGTEKQYGEQVSSAEGPVSIDGKGACTVTFQYKGGDKGNNKLNLAGVQLLSSKGAVLDSDFHNGSTGDSNAGNTYTVQVPSRGNYILRYWAQTKSEPIASKGEITFPCPCARWRKSRNPRRTNPGWPRDSGAVKPPCSPGKYGTYPPFSEFLPPASNAAPSWPIWNGNA